MFMVTDRRLLTHASCSFTMSNHAYCDHRPILMHLYSRLIRGNES